MVNVIEDPPACQRCGQELPGDDPLQRRYSPEDAHRYGPEHQPPAPVRVYKPKTGETSWWCSSRCFRAAHKKPAKTRKGKPGRHQQLNLRPDKSAA